MPINRTPLTTVLQLAGDLTYDKTIRRFVSYTVETVAKDCLGLVSRTNLAWSKKEICSWAKKSTIIHRWLLRLLSLFVPWECGSCDCSEGRISGLIIRIGNEGHYSLMEESSVLEDVSYNGHYFDTKIATNNYWLIHGFKIFWNCGVFFCFVFFQTKILLTLKSDIKQNTYMRNKEDKKDADTFWLQFFVRLHRGMEEMADMATHWANIGSCVKCMVSIKQGLDKFWSVHGRIHFCHRDII